MNVNYKMMGVVLCGAMLLASGCGAKAETTASSAVESESVSVVALEAASSEAVPESEAVSEAVSEASSAVSEAASEKPAESKAESKADGCFLQRRKDGACGKQARYRDCSGRNCQPGNCPEVCG